MNKIGIIVAMEEELEAVLNIMNNIEQKEIYGISVQIGKIEQKEVAVVKSGVGKVNAARVTQILIDKLNVKSIINLGAAGALSPLLNIGDIVIGEKLIQHDFDITAFDHEKGFIPNCGVYLNSDDYLLNIAKNISIENVNIHEGVIASGDIFCTDKHMSEKIHNKFNALCVDMEGASIAQTSFLAGVPFIVIRSISDIPNNQNVMTYDKFLERSSNIVSLFLKEMIDKL